MYCTNVQHMLCMSKIIVKLFSLPPAEERWIKSYKNACAHIQCTYGAVRQFSFIMGHFLPLFDRSVAGNRVRNRNVSKPNLSQGHSAFSKTERPFCLSAPQHDAAATTLHCRDPVGQVGSVFLQTWCWEENSGQKFNLGFNRPKTVVWVFPSLRETSFCLSTLIGGLLQWWLVFQIFLLSTDKISGAQPGWPFGC